MPPMPPLAAPSLASLSATMASVAISRPAIEAASSREVRTILAGSLKLNGENHLPYEYMFAMPFQVSRVRLKYCFRWN